MQFELYQISDKALEIKLGHEISFDTLDKVIAVKNQIELAQIESITEITTAYASLGIYFDEMKISFNEISNDLSHLLTSFTLNTKEPKRYSSISIPVCYDAKVAFDLNNYLAKKSLSLDQFISYHSKPEYRLFMKGFLPGFMYLGILDEALLMPRKETPAMHVKAGSIAIGGGQTGVYGIDSPGGWWVIGRTPLNLFDPKKGVLLDAKIGDRLTFEPISLSQFLDAGGSL